MAVGSMICTCFVEELGRANIFNCDFPSNTHETDGVKKYDALYYSDVVLRHA